MALKYKEGQTAIVSKRLHGHNFKIGEEVKIIDVITDSDTPHYKACKLSNPCDYWWLQDDELTDKQ